MVGDTEPVGDMVVVAEGMLAAVGGMLVEAVGGSLVVEDKVDPGDSFAAAGGKTDLGGRFETVPSKPAAAAEVDILVAQRCMPDLLAGEVLSV